MMMVKITMVMMMMTTMTMMIVMMTTMMMVFQESHAGEGGEENQAGN